MNDLGVARSLIKVSLLEAEDGQGLREEMSKEIPESLAKVGHSRGGEP